MKWRRERVLFFTLSASCFMSTVKKKQQLSAARSQLGFSHKSVLISGVIGGTMLSLRLIYYKPTYNQTYWASNWQKLSLWRINLCLAKPAEIKLLGIIKKYKGYLTTNRAFFSVVRFIWIIRGYYMWCWIRMWGKNFL